MEYDENDSIRSTPSDVYFWQDGIPVYHEPRALQAVDTALSYWISCHEEINYNVYDDPNFIPHGIVKNYSYSGGHTFLNGETVNGTGANAGKGLIDCSTFIHLVLRGIRYEDSPYAHSNPNNRYEPSQLDLENCYKWGNRSITASFSVANSFFTGAAGEIVRYAHQLARYFMSAGRVYKCRSDNYSEVRPGDLVFYKPKPQYPEEDSDAKNEAKFCDITHVGIITENTSKILNVSSLDPVVLKSDLVMSKREIVFFARPDYGRLWWEKPHSECNYLDLPWLMTQINSEPSGILASSDPNKVTVWTHTEPNQQAAGPAVIVLVNRYHPFYLPAGTYRLSGAPAHMDRRSNVGSTHWGLRLKREDNANIKHKSYGYSGAPFSGNIVSQVFTDLDHVWDRGFGAEFTLENGSYMRASIYIAECPGEDNVPYSNTDPTVDVWRPKLIRID